MANASNTQRSSPYPLARSRARRSEIGLSLFVAVTVGLLVVPVPPMALDLLLATSFALSILVLLVVLYAKDALTIATFPTLLLLTTLYRLSLNVSTARAILLRADAGEMVRAFGSFVVQGNYLVGAVVFLILTIVQFVVIARGAERVAEVAARFALDAMPGKQMAIDADLRAGTIDRAVARRRRGALERESHFYGAMDGAMKFVKGDVIASTIITCVNLLGGLAVGVLQRGMGAEQALRRYGLLTIGDGLVTQIPALVASTAAGLLVTRVASEEADAALGQELGRHLFGDPRALWSSAGLLAVLSLVPGLPTAPLMVLGGAMAIAAHLRGSELSRARREGLVRSAVTQEPLREFVPLVVPWDVVVGPGLAEHLDDGERPGSTGLVRRLQEVRERVFQDLGLPLPPAVLAIDPRRGPHEATVRVREVPVWTTPGPEDGSIVAPEARVQGIADACRSVLLRHGHQLFGVGETQALLDALEAHKPGLVPQIVPKPLSVPLLAEVLRRLLEEGISIRDLPTILEGLAPHAKGTTDALELAEAARAGLRRAITYMLCGGAPALEVLTLDPMIENVIRSSISRSAAGAHRPLGPSAARDIVQSVRAALAQAPLADGPSPRPRDVILTAPDVRRFVRKVLEAEHPDLFVVSYGELEPELRLVTRARVVPL